MYYVFTEIKGKIIAFQLTHDGERKLKTAGIFPGRTFGRALLLDLYRSGDAFTYGRGLERMDQEFEPRQLEFDFAKDPEPESLFPLCAICSSPDDLHLVEMKGQTPLREPFVRRLPDEPTWVHRHKHPSFPCDASHVGAIAGNEAYRKERFFRFKLSVPAGCGI